MADLSGITPPGGQTRPSSGSYSGTSTRHRVLQCLHFIRGRLGTDVCVAGEPAIDAAAVLAAIALRRGLRRRGGEADLERAAAVLLQDFRDGVLGRISLETPATRQRMLALAAEPAQKSSPVLIPTSPC